jgi:type IV pilus assembly protein PilC
MNKRRPFFITMPLKEKISFFKRLSLYMHSGVSIPIAFKYLQESAIKKSDIYVYLRIEEKILLGNPLSTGLEQFSKIFDSFCIGFIQAGEKSGFLSETLEQLAQILSKRATLRKKVVSAMIYPIIVLLSTIILTAFLTFFIFPKILPVFKGLKTQLPWSTRVLIYINATFTKDWIVILASCAIIIIICVLLLKIEKVVSVLENLLIHVPLLGTLYKYYALSAILTTISIQLAGNILLPNALELIRKTLPGVLYPRAIAVIQADLYQGKRFSESVKNFAQLFPILIPQLIATGEATGTLTSSISLLSQNYDESLDEITKNLTTLIEPILMICMGCIVGFVALAIITPIYKVTQNLTIQ